MANGFRMRVTVDVMRIDAMSTCSIHKHMSGIYHIHMSGIYHYPVINIELFIVYGFKYLMY